MAKAFNLLLTLVGGVLQTYTDPSAKYGHRSTRKVSILLRSLTMFFLASSGLCLAQQGGQDIPKTAPVPPQQPSNRSETDAPSFMVKAVTNIVVVDLVARDKEDNPVRDLAASDLQVSEKIGGSSTIPERIASFEPVTEAVRQRSTRASGIALGWLHPSFCPLTGAYELSYYLSPESRKDGLHRISVSSSRPGVRLFFRSAYKIEADKPVAASAEGLADQKTNPQLQKQRRLQAERKQHPELELSRVACYDALDVTKFGVNVQKVEAILVDDPATSKTTGKANEGSPIRLDTFEFIVPSSYFASLSADERNRPTQLDFSLCMFDLLGHPLRYFDGTVEAGTTSTRDESLSVQGFSHSFTVSAVGGKLVEISGQRFSRSETSARLVVLDRNTRAMGSGELLLADLGPDPFRSPIPEGLTTDSFGTLNPTSPLAMCGDVYQLAPWTTKLPRFSELDAVAPIYVTSLGVYSRFFTAGIPNVTSRTEWFGVNYQGRFGVDTAGKYEFDLVSDDGAKVYIDDKLVVSDDTTHSPRHSRGKIQLNTGTHGIRVSYFQGPRIEVALVLLVKPPRRGWRLFDTTDSPAPEEPALQRRKLPELER